MSVRTPGRLVRFGVFEFDLSSGDLWKGGRRIKLQNQPRQILKALVSRPGELVSRDELRRQLWPGDTFVDFDNGLNVAVRKIRDALGDLTPSPEFIETERALGYRFVAPVTEVTEPAPPPVSANPSPSIESNRYFVAALFTLVLVAAITGWLWSRTAPPDGPASISVAVLPFNGGSGEDEQLLALGIPDGIVTRLSNVRQFRVRSTSAVARFHGRTVDAQFAGRQLRAQYVLSGSIRSTGDRVRVSAQLVRTTDGSPIWGDQYDVPRGDLLAVEDAVARQIAGVLRLRMSDAERERFYRRYTRSGQAYERYLMGRAHLRSVTEQGALRAIAEFESARDLDPDYALAYAGIATAAAQLRVRFASDREYKAWDTRARDEAGRALQLDPDLAEAHVALAAVHRFQEYDWYTVIQESRRAQEQNPGLETPYLYLAVAYTHLGLLEEAERALEVARELNPENTVERAEILGAVHLFAARAPDALNHLSQAESLSDSRIVKYLLGWSRFYTGQPLHAEASLQSMIDDEGPLPSNARATLAAIRAARGASADARALAERVAAERELMHHGAYGLGTAYAQLGDPAVAVRWLSRAATTGFPCYPWYARDPLLDPIREDPGFVAFMRDLQRSWTDARAKYAEAAVTSHQSAR